MKRDRCQYCTSPATHEVAMGGYTQYLCERHYWKGIEMEEEYGHGCCRDD